MPHVFRRNKYGHSSEINTDTLIRGNDTRRVNERHSTFLQACENIRRYIALLYFKSRNISRIEKYFQNVRASQKLEVRASQLCYEIKYVELVVMK